jgi:2-oxoglutarate dehydrogenase E1 component
MAVFAPGFKGPEQISKIKNTGVNPEVLKQVGKAVTTFPEGFNPHRGIKRVYEQRQKMIETGEVRGSNAISMV